MECTTRLVKVLSEGVTDWQTDELSNWARMTLRMASIKTLHPREVEPRDAALSSYHVPSINGALKRGRSHVVHSRQQAGEYLGRRDNTVPAYAAVHEGLKVGEVLRYVLRVKEVF